MALAQGPQQFHGIFILQPHIYDGHRKMPSRGYVACLKSCGDQGRLVLTTHFDPFLKDRGKCFVAINDQDVIAHEASLSCR